MYYVHHGNKFSPYTARSSTQLNAHYMIKKLN